ncbi:MAG: hypothetical protein O8C66_09270 [Candidatus Methanoperedens sp.]|nr:hypothetical protein [Candidatus Methanoperedens sp.]MCZ7370684.1 hypothetical protein [Candidatus Methanoperedens sp.]
MKRNGILMCLILLAVAVAIPEAIATYTAQDVTNNACNACHPAYVSAIASNSAITFLPRQHDNIDNSQTTACLICHRGAYDTSTHTVSGYIGYQVTVTTCNTLQNGQPGCHATSGSRPVDTNTHTGNAASPADCTKCHFANTTKVFPLSSSHTYYQHDHNFTVEYNFYNYNLLGMPLSADGHVGKGMFPYYTCTLTCHTSKSKENITIGWNQSKHAQSYTGSETMSCARCKSPPNYNVSANQSAPVAAADWQGIQCRVCHDMHNVSYSSPVNGEPLAFYNGTLSSRAGYPVYVQVHNATELCEKCHTTTSHDSKFAGIHKDPAGANFTCASCHANRSIESDLTQFHTFEVKNTTSNVTGCEVCHKSEDHTFQFTSMHTGKVECVACHDQTFTTVNATNYSVSSDGNYGLWKPTPTSNWTTYVLDRGKPKTWPLHNITKSVDCSKCHNATSVFNGTITTGLVCADCHPTYATAYNASKHNQTLNASAPACIDCHVGYVPSYGHTTGAKGFTVNESNTCRNSGCHQTKDEKHTSTDDCTMCHFANMNTSFSLNASLYVHDHNLTIIRNFYQYNLTGTIQMPLKSNGGVGVGTFPYYSCDAASCHHHDGSNVKVDNASQTWVQSAHAQSLVEPPTDQKNSCAKCKSPLNYNASASSGTLIPVADWQGINCRVCHNLHNRSFSSPGTGILAFYNATLSSLAGYTIYDTVANATVLCEKCHYGDGHDSKFAGTHKTQVGFDCADCHLNTTSGARFNYQSHMFEVTNLTTGVTGCEVCHKSGDHTFQFTANHTGKVTCEACHDKTVARNATGYAVGLNSTGVKIIYGLYNDTATGLISSYKDGSAAPTTWPLHNISKDVSCDKCHGTKSAVTSSLLAPTFGDIGCVKCHSSYASAVNNSNHNQTMNVAAPNCTDCHAGYDTQHNGYTGYIVNESNSCRNCHVEGVNLSESHGNHGYGQNYADCTQCHFANTTQQFALNSSLYTHDHNLTVEYNFYNYNLTGIPLSTNGGVGKGMFPYYTCTLTCHNGTGGGQPKIENETIAWNQSGHAQSSLHGTYYSGYCLKCHSPPMYNQSNSARYNTSNNQGVQCRVCHNLHNDTYSGNGTSPIYIAFYNATSSSSAGSPVYDTVGNVTELCEKCHNGSSHHISDRDIYYDGSHKTSLGFTCADCHMNSTINNGSEHTFEVNNIATTKTGCEACHVATSEHTTSNFREYSSHGNVTCDACHDDTFVRNSTDYVVNVSTGKVKGGVYRNQSTNKWTTYRGTSTATDWTFHNISKTIDCNKCHGARSVFNGSIAPNLTSGGTTYYTTDTLVSEYNLIVLWLNPNPTLYAGNLLYTSSTGIPGVSKVLKWDSTNQIWVSYQIIVPSGGVGFYSGTNFTMAGYKPYFIKGNGTTNGNTYTFVGTK